MAAPANRIDATGTKYGMLTAIRQASSGKNYTTKWLFRCDCGNEKEINFNNVRRGLTQSCGCLHKKKTTTHGKSQSKEYGVWSSMIQRCTNQKDKHYENYGGRGITVSPEWRTFSNFIADMGERPTPKHTIERIENDKGYCKENCKWATRSEQNRNHRGNVHLSAFGKTMILSDWAREAGISAKTLEKRRRLGWCDKCIITGGFDCCRKRSHQ